ncbi:MAG: decaprenyl-phosphate phosphoribosyltransferase [Dethiobacteria bacterium]
MKIREQRQTEMLQEISRGSFLPLLGAAFNLLRPRQWTKNFFLLAGLVFSGNLFCTPLLCKAVLAFGTFCLLSGAVYIMNDIIDLEEDRKHAQKRYRPLAAGRIRVGQARVIFLLLLAVSFCLSFVLGKYFLLVAVLYFLLVMGYSLYFKHIVILDVFAVAFGFLLRAVAGGAAIGVRISPWLLICTLLLALFLALTKRRQEYLSLGAGGREHRQVLADYSVAYLDQLIAVVTAATIMAYSLYSFTASPTQDLMLTIPFVIYGIFRYLFLVHQRALGGSPEEVLLKDRPLGISILLWVLACVLLLYTRPGLIISI